MIDIGRNSLEGSVLVERFILLNGNLVDTSTDLCGVSIHDRAFNFGDGVYEVIRIYNGEYHMLPAHLNRLKNSLLLIGMKPVVIQDLLSSLTTLLTVNDFREDGILYLQYSRGVQLRNHVPDENIDHKWIAYLQKKKRDLSPNSNGVHIQFIEDKRWLMCNIKSLNLLPNTLAKSEAINNNCFEAILHRGGYITEGSTSNFFCVKNNALFTKAADNLILNGIVRQTVIELARSIDLVVHEIDTMTIEDVLSSDECFITGTTVEILPVVGVLDKKKWEIGKVTKKLQKLFDETI